MQRSATPHQCKTPPPSPVAAEPMWNVLQPRPEFSTERLFAFFSGMLDGDDEEVRGSDPRAPTRYRYAHPIVSKLSTTFRPDGRQPSIAMRMFDRLVG